MSNNDKIFEKLNKKVNALVGIGTNREFLKRTARKLAAKIKARTRDGYGTKKFGGVLHKLKPLSPEYIAQRKKKRLSAKTSATKSNLTKSGQMLDAIRGRVKGEAMEIYFTSARRNTTLSNPELAAFHEKGDGVPRRSFINPSRKEIDLVEDEIAQEINEIFK